MKNKFELYCASEITPQMTLLEKLNKILDFLKANPTYNVYVSNEEYTNDSNAYSVSEIHNLHSSAIFQGDAIFFKNGYLGFVVAGGTQAYLVRNAIKINVDQFLLYDLVKGSDYINVDLDENEEHLQVRLDQSIVERIFSSIRKPQVPLETKKMVVMLPNGNEDFEDIPTGGGGRNYSVTINNIANFPMEITYFTAEGTRNTRYVPPSERITITCSEIFTTMPVALNISNGQNAIYQDASTNRLAYNNDYPPKYANYIKCTDNISLVIEQL